MRLAFAALALTLGMGSVSAAELSGIGAAIFGNSFNFKQANLEKAPVGAIKVGKLDVTLQRTKLKDVQKALRRHAAGRGRRRRARRLALLRDRRRQCRFIANALGGHEFVMMVAAEAGKPAKGCDPRPPASPSPNFGIPGLGAPTAELKPKFGAASGNKIAYRSDRPGGYSDIAQYIGYTMKSGKVGAIGVGETSVPTAH